MKARSLAACFPFSCPKKVLFGRRSGVPIRCRLTANPEEAPKVRAANRSYVFFRITGLSTEGEPVGAQGVPLTPGRSIAVDRLHEYGTPFFIETNLPIESGKRASPFHRLMIAQDTGSAIVGPARADLYWGAGDDAGRIAGRIRHRGRFVMLLPRELDMIEAGRHMPLPVPKPRILEHRSAATRSVLQRRRTFIEFGADIDTLDKKLDDAGLLSGEKLTPQRIEPFQRLAHLSFRNLLTRLPRRAPSAHDNLGRSQQTAQLIDHRGFNLARAECQQGVADPAAPLRETAERKASLNVRCKSAPSPDCQQGGQ